MSGVKWIQLNIDIFGNPKVKYLRSLKPDGNNLVLIWIMLLAAAGRSNTGGKICVTETIPMSAAMLAEEFKFKESVINRALGEMLKLDMVYMQDGFIIVTGWEEHQNLAGLDRIREQTRNRVAKHRQGKSVTPCNVTVTEKVTHGNAIDIDIEKEIDKDIKNKKNSHFVPPTIEEVRAYCTERNNGIDAEGFIAFYESKGWKVGNQKMSNWKSAIVTWEKRNKKPQQQKQSAVPKPNKFNQFPQRNYTAQDYAELERKLLNKGL